VLTQLVKAGHTGTIDRWHRQYHTQHTVCGKQGREQTAVLAAMRERGVCWPGIQLVLEVEIHTSRRKRIDEGLERTQFDPQAVARQPHGLTGEQPANALSAATRDSIVSRVLACSKTDPEKKQLHVHHHQLNSIKGLLAAVAQAEGCSPAAVRIVLSTHTLTAGYKLVPKRRDHNYCQFCKACETTVLTVAAAEA